MMRKILPLAKRPARARPHDQGTDQYSSQYIPQGTTNVHHVLLWFSVLFLCVIMLCAAPNTAANAQMLGANDRIDFTAGVAAPPLSLQGLLRLEKKTFGKKNAADDMALDIRKEAIREGAISYGARGGLAWQTYNIRRQMQRRASYMDTVFDFRQLLIPAPSGLMIEPPIISESQNNMFIETDGQQAAVNDRMYNIMMNARIVSAPRLWRNYLEREWDAVQPPPDLLLPETPKEIREWEGFVRMGWEQGLEQANEIFQEDLNLMLSDFRGMVRYRLLLSQGMISPPYALQVDRGVTGGGDEMRIGDRAVQITGKPELITGHEQWQPANQ